MRVVTLTLWESWTRWGEYDQLERLTKYVMKGWRKMRTLISRKPPPTNRNSEGGIGWFHYKVRASITRPTITRIPDTFNRRAFKNSFALSEMSQSSNSSDSLHHNLAI